MQLFVNPDYPFMRNKVVEIGIGEGMELSTNESLNRLNWEFIPDRAHLHSVPTKAERLSKLQRYSKVKAFSIEPKAKQNFTFRSPETHAIRLQNNLKEVSES